jgi:hypothetical protein
VTLSTLSPAERRRPEPYSPEVGRRLPPLVGRERELSPIDDLIGSASAGRGRTLVLEGEAGIGKSRLADACDERATAAHMHRGHRVGGKHPQRHIARQGGERPPPPGGPLTWTYLVGGVGFEPTTFGL